MICDLWSEACNPDAVIELLQNGASVRHVEGFHAKTYLYPDRVIAGSANASRAGLGGPDEIAPTRTETALLCDDPAVLEEARAWFDLAWKKGTPLDVAAVEAYRPAAASRQAPPSLLEALANTPELFAGLDLVLTVYRDDGYSDEAVATWATVKGEYGGDDMHAYAGRGSSHSTKFRRRMPQLLSPDASILTSRGPGRSLPTTAFGRFARDAQSLSRAPARFW